jgi:hypothetical protein
MALKIYDTFAPQGEYPAVKAEDVEMPDGSRLSDFEGGGGGADGKDGVSPTVTITAITGGHRVSITDASGTKTFDVMDGEDGSSASIIVDDALSETSENPVQNKVITAQMNSAIGILQTQVLPKLLPSVTTSDNGKVLSVTDGVWVVKEITGGSGGSITVDSELSPDSTNPVQNKVIYAQLVQANTVLGQLQASIPTDAHINGLIDTYLSEALGGDY